ncbi:hypothetical protein KI387_000328, partial [Taxus chinensis]
VMFSWLDDEATDDMVSRNDNGERGVTTNKYFDDGVYLGLIGGQDLCMDVEGVGHFKENAG